MMRCRLCISALLVVCTIVGGNSVAAERRAAQQATAPPSADLAALLAAARDPNVPLHATQQRHADTAGLPVAAASLAPIRTFLLAEAWRTRGAGERARSLYRSLLDEAASDAGQGGSSALAAFALWRLLGDSVADSMERRRILETGTRYWQRRDAVVRGLFDAPRILGVLPQMREEILRGFVASASMFGEREQAQRWMSEYLAAARTTTLTDQEREILDGGAQRGVLDRDRLLLGLAKRVQGLGKGDEARPLFALLLGSPDREVTADARLQLAQFLRDAQGRPCASDKLRSEVDAVIASRPSADLLQRALYFRSQRHLQRNCPVDLERYHRDLDRLRRDYPQGPWTLQALSRIASHHLEQFFDSGSDAQLERALGYFSQLRTSVPAPEKNTDAAVPRHIRNLLEMAWFNPALALYIRGRATDRTRAMELLTEKLARWPDGALRQSARFWLARIADEAGRGGVARAHWTAIVEDSPYDYYAIRARMRLKLGGKARERIELDAATRAALVGQAKAGTAPASAAPVPISPFQARLSAAIEAGVYQQALEAYYALRRDSFPGDAIEDLPLDSLDRVHRLADVALMLALRQDAMAAAEKSADPSARLRIAAEVGNWRPVGWLEGDWALAVVLSGARALPEKERRALQHDRNFLNAAYPGAYDELVRKHASGRGLPPELLYGVIRTESIFNPVAVSASDAIGLCQFLPGTFLHLNRKWRLIDKADPVSIRSYLLTPEKNIALGARWFADELLPGQNGNLLWALMAHNAGPGAVARWKNIWRRMGRLDDFEFMAETARFEETRGFARRALTAYWIAGATGLLGSSSK
jgi:soluble lytic murein transglycosylase-like protein